MKLNQYVEVYVDKLAIRRNIMMIGVLVKDKSGKPESLEIKLKVSFSNSEEKRIVPLPVVGSNYDENGYYIGYAYFEYEMDTIFRNRDLNEFVVDVQIYNEGIYQSVIVEDMSFNQLKAENEYKCVVENRQIIIRRKKPIKAHYHNMVLSFLCGIYRLVELLIGTLLIPLFLLDGIYVIILNKSRRMEEENFGGSQLKRTLLFAKWRYSSFCRLTINLSKLKRMVLDICASILTIFVKKDSILFVSSRRADLSGNIAYVNNVLCEKGAKVLFWLEPGKTKNTKWGRIFSLANMIARSKVVVVDDFTPILNDVLALKKCRLIQLWHACGAFKTFGFSRLGKDGGPNQTTPNHRNYDYAIVSSSEIKRFYAEGFGIDEKNVLPLGVPRTDDFFDIEHGKAIRERVYTEYPVLKDKKVILFAPTFRGNGANTAFYPFEKFDVNALLEQVGEEYVVIVKHHPFVLENHPIKGKYADRILDLSKESEINDLLFVTDLLITDYSSVIFEASLLNIPMLFYAYDLEDYVVNRDFYYPFKNFVPGKIVRNMEQIKESIQKKDFEVEKVEVFKHRFFDDLDGKSSERVADFIMELMKK